MPWLQLSIQVPRERLETAEAALQALGAASITFRDAHDDPVLEPPPGQTPLWPEVVATGLFAAETDPEALQKALAERLGAPQPPLRLEVLEDQDWERSWMEDFRPMRFGERLWICPSWERPPQPEAVNIRLDPGLAFGTGTHPTTALCLCWLDAHPPQGGLIIDYGCGSGILAVAALKLGARHAWAVDIDPQALAATEANAAKNGIAEGDLYVVSPDGLPPVQADLLLANILSGPLVALAPRLAALLRPGGDLVLSGILEDQIEPVAKAYAPWVELAPPQRLEGWALLHGRRRGV